MTIEWLAGNRLRGTTAERPSASLQSPSVGGWVEVGRTTLGSSASSISISSLPDKRYYKILANIYDASGTANAYFRLNDDSSSNYSYRRSINGGSDTTATSTTTPYIAHDEDFFNVMYLVNKSDKEKLLQSHHVNAPTTGSGTAPARDEVVAKWSNSSNAVNRIDLITGASFASGSEVVVLGWDPADSHTTNFWEELADVSWSSGKSISTGTFTPKKYLWLQGWMTKTGTAGGSVYLRIGNGSVDTGSNYAHRYNINGGTDGTQTSNSNGIFLDQGSSANCDRWFFNAFFINNAGNEKLGIINDVWSLADGASTAPQRTEHTAKWSNTSDQINIFEILGMSISDFTGGQLKVWGSD